VSGADRRRIDAIAAARYAGGMLARAGALVAIALCALAGAAHAEDQVGHRPSAWEREGFPAREAMRFGDAYRDFLTAHKTEREVVAAAIAMAKKQGHRDLLGKRPVVKPGARLYAVVHDKMAALVVVGTQPLEAGVHLVVAHADAVRIDLKQKPLYDDGNLGLLQTHYYGDIKSYQWLGLPLELRGVVIKRGGQRIDVAIGDDPDEPVLVIPDVSPEVSHFVDRIEGEQVPGESLDPIVASTPGTGADPYAAEAARLLEKQYGITAADLLSAELALVPAGAARDVGVDRAMIGGYGQDGRAAVYSAVRALLDVGRPEHTAIVLLVDKSEIGSTGNTGARSAFLRRVVAELLEASDATASEIAVDRVLAASRVIAADAIGAVNPHYPELYDPDNTAFAGGGVVWQPTAVHAELMSYLRTLLDDAGVVYQTGAATETKGSKSESGSLLRHYTRLGMSGADLSIPVLSLHSPFEVISKADLYSAYRAYRAFLED
jgi:aspartyl aminopeptidase